MCPVTRETIALCCLAAGAIIVITLLTSCATVDESLRPSCVTHCRIEEREDPFSQGHQPRMVGIPVCECVESITQP